MVQDQGNYVKFYNNTVTGIADSAFDFDAFSNCTPHDVWYFNNVIDMQSVIDKYPDAFRFYTSTTSVCGAVQSITNFKIFNNVFADLQQDHAVVSFYRTAAIRPGRATRSRTTSGSTAATAPPRARRC